MKKQIWEQLACFLMATLCWCGEGQLSPPDLPRSLTHQPGPVAPAFAPPDSQKRVFKAVKLTVRAGLCDTFLKGEYHTSEPFCSVGMEASWSRSVISANRECRSTVIISGDLMIQGSFLVNGTNCSSLCAGPFSPFQMAGECLHLYIMCISEPMST